MKRVKNLLYSLLSILHSNRYGFSLLEVLISIAIISLLIFALASFRNNIDFLGNFITQNFKAKSDIEQSLQILTTEIRSAGPSNLGAYPIDSTSASSFSFYSDIDKDGLFERVRYFAGTSTVNKSVIKPSGNPLIYATSSEIITTAISRVVWSSSTSLFSYFDSNYTGTELPIASTTNVSIIRSIRISFYADVSTSSAPKAEYFTRFITIRNLKTN
jgi:prepilin-type N-terminal cleavage/methylation domain-containing protein